MRRGMNRFVAMVTLASLLLPTIVGCGGGLKEDSRDLGDSGVVREQEAAATVAAPPLPGVTYTPPEPVDIAPIG
jgi:hypothetical protein